MCKRWQRERNEVCECGGGSEVVWGRSREDVWGEDDREARVCTKVE